MKKARIILLYFLLTFPCNRVLNAHDEELRARGSRLSDEYAMSNIIDVRPAGAFFAFHAPGSINMVPKRIHDCMGNQEPWILVGDGLENARFVANNKNCVMLGGGIVVWHQYGAPLVGSGLRATFSRISVPLFWQNRCEKWLIVSAYETDCFMTSAPVSIEIVQPILTVSSFVESVLTAVRSKSDIDRVLIATRKGELYNDIENQMMQEFRKLTVQDGGWERGLRRSLTYARVAQPDAETRDHSNVRRDFFRRDVRAIPFFYLEGGVESLIDYRKMEGESSARRRSTVLYPLVTRYALSRSPESVAQTCCIGASR